MSGRNIPGLTDKFGENTVRFPKLANTVRKQIATSALSAAKANYYKKYDILSDRMQTDLVKVANRLAKNADLNQKDVEIAVARDACVNMAAISAFAKAPVGQSLWAKIVIGIIVVAAIVVATIFTCGAAGVGVLAGFMAHAGLTFLTVASVAGATGAVTAGATALAVSTVAIVAGTIGAAAAGTAYAIADGVQTAQDNSAFEAEIASHQYNVTETHGEYYANEWNYIEKITTDFDNDTMICTRCISKKYCQKTAWHLFSDRNCKKWETDDFVDERCNEIQF